MFRRNRVQQPPSMHSLEIAQPHRSNTISNVRFPHLLITPPCARTFLLCDKGEIATFYERTYGHTIESDLFSSDSDRAVVLDHKLVHQRQNLRFSRVVPLAR